MKHCHCGWSGDDSITVCPNAANHPPRSVAMAAQIGRDRERLNVLAGGFTAQGLRGPVKHYLSDWMDVYQTDDGRYVTADGKPVKSPKKGLR